MAINVGDNVWVPAERLGLMNEPGVFARREVTSVSQRSVRVRLPNGNESEPIASSKAHDRLGLLVISVGDFTTESTLLEPLTKSVLQYMRLFFTDESQVRRRQVRSTAELAHYWAEDSPLFSHVVLIAHGKRDAIEFAVDGWQNPEQLGAVLTGNAQKVFVSLACRTGLREFAGPFSLLPCCSALVAPFHSVHGAMASQFCQTFFAHLLLDGCSPKVAFNKSTAARLPTGSSFRFWKAGLLQ